MMETLSFLCSYAAEECGCLSCTSVRQAMDAAMHSGATAAGEGVLC